MSRLRDAFERGEFVVTGEIAPPRGTDLKPMLRAVEILGPVTHALNVTDNQGATLHLSSAGAAHAILEAGYEPILQQTCRDRNRLALQSELLTAWTLGLENLLALTGDDPRAGDHPQAKGVFDIDSTQLIEVVASLNRGEDMMGRALDGGTGFFVGGAAFPEAEPWDIQLDRVRGKVQAGARFLQTQAVMDVDTFCERVEELRGKLGVKVIAGVLLLKNARVIEFVNERLPGMQVPEATVDRIRAAADPLEESVLVAIEQTRALRQVADGVHVMSLGADEQVPRILQAAGVI